MTIKQMLYEGFKTKVICGQQLTEEFDIKTGVKQGCILSQFLFYLAIDWIMKRTYIVIKGGIIWTFTESLGDLVFADDISLLANSHISSSSSLGSRCVPWLGEGLSLPSPNYPVLGCPLPYRVAPVFVQVVSPPLGWSPLSSFLVIWSPSGDARGPSVVFEAVNRPCPGPFHFSHSVDYIYEFCPLPDPDVGPSIFVCDVEHTSFHFGPCGRKFVL